MYGSSKMYLQTGSEINMQKELDTFLEWRSCE